MLSVITAFYDKTFPSFQFECLNFLFFSRRPNILVPDFRKILPSIPPPRSYHYFKITQNFFFPFPNLLFIITPLQGVSKAGLLGEERMTSSLYSDRRSQPLCSVQHLFKPSLSFKLTYRIILILQYYNNLPRYYFNTSCTLNIKRDSTILHNFGTHFNIVYILHLVKIILQNRVH